MRTRSGEGAQMVWRVAGPVILLLTLAGCQSAAERRVADDAKCSGYGFKPGTEAFANCRMSQDQERARRTAEINAQTSADIASAQASVNSSTNQTISTYQQIIRAH